LWRSKAPAPEVAGVLDDASAMSGDGRVDEVAAKAPKTRDRALLVGAGEPAISDDICNHDRRRFPNLGHRTFRREQN
jgi:hypothetical protein